MQRESLEAIFRFEFGFAYTGVKNEYNLLRHYIQYILHFPSGSFIRPKMIIYIWTNVGGTEDFCQGRRKELV